MEAVRARYRAKRDLLAPVLAARGLRHAGGDASFFLWLDAGPDADALAARMLEAGILVAPGSYFGPRARATSGSRSSRRRRRASARPSGSTRCSLSRASEERLARRRSR